MVRSWLSYVYVNTLVADASPEFPWTQYMQRSGPCWSRVASKARSPTNFGFHSAVQKECAAGLVRVSPSDTFKAACLQWLRQMKKFPTVPAGQAFEKTCKGED